ncbi:MotA/TolQ/ExbB proton channel family protein [Myxococcota bacterium]|nr:MotA/TolQ/ExbB proton channel family protein [Myxococcota bacterium]
MEKITDFDSLIRLGGPTLVVLLTCSVVALAVAIERAWALFRALAGTERLCLDLEDSFERNQLDVAQARCQASPTALASILTVGFERLKERPETIRPAMERERQRVLLRLRGPLWLLGTIGAVTPFVGLFGTVNGIMAAFHEIGETHQAGLDVVGPGIAEALLVTAVGILVAVIALAFYNYFQARLSRLGTELRLLQDEFTEAFGDVLAQARAQAAGGAPSEPKP